MIDVNKYKNLMGNVIPPIFPRAYLFGSEPLDYTLPFTRRYFVKKANDNEIIEVGSKNYKTIPGNIYIKVALRWKIKGESVDEHNKEQVKLAETKMPGLSKRVTNYIAGFKKT